MKEDAKRTFGITLKSFVFLEVILALWVLFSFFPLVQGVIGVPNATVQTFLEVGESFPEILNITVDDYNASVTLNANTTKTVTCTAMIVDYNNDTTLDNLTAVFYDTVVSSEGDSDDNNYHYTNNSCVFNLSFGTWHGIVDDDYHALGICTFEVEYYANAENWNCSMTVTDNTSLSDTQQDDIIIDPLLAIGLPDSINYGRVNATYVSEEQVANVSNVGNTQINLSLSGYARTEGDGLAMNCSLGRVGSIDIDYEKYNLTETTPGNVSLTTFENLYINLTSSPVIKKFDLNYRQNDAYNEAVKGSFWRIYVPRGAAGSCQGNIIFGAVVANGT